MANAARSNGVKYISGDAGYVKKLVYEQDGTCTGAVSADGTVHKADIVLLASGANTATLVDLAKQEVVAQCSAIMVIQLEPHEVEKYKNIPIIDDFEQGRLATLGFTRVLQKLTRSQASSSPRMRTA